MNSKYIFFSILIMAFAAFSGPSAASERELQLDLMATKAHPRASGTAIVRDGNISIQANGLKPNAVYTAWFVNLKPQKHETGAGQPPFMFKTDSDGNGRYSSPLAGSPIGKWQMLMIVLHPNGDPTDMKNMLGALSAKL